MPPKQIMGGHRPQVPNAPGNVSNVQVNVPVNVQVDGPASAGTVPRRGSVESGGGRNREGRRERPQRWSRGVPQALVGGNVQVERPDGPPRARRPGLNWALGQGRIVYSREANAAGAGAEGGAGASAQGGGEANRRAGDEVHDGNHVVGGGAAPHDGNHVVGGAAPPGADRMTGEVTAHDGNHVVGEGTARDENQVAGGGTTRDGNHAAGGGTGRDENQVAGGHDGGDVYPLAGGAAGQGADGNAGGAAWQREFIHDLDLGRDRLKPIRVSPLPGRTLLKSPGKPIKGPYKRIEPLSTQLQFDNEGNTVGASEAQRKAIEAQRRDRGLPEDELACRIELVDRRIRGAYAVRAARDLADPTGRKDVLSVFTAPEWTFKMPKKPLTRKQRDQIVEHYRKLSRQHRKMLIIPGTIVYNAGDDLNPRIRAEAIVVYEGKVVKTTRKRKEGFDTDGYSRADGQPVNSADFEGAPESDSSVFEFKGFKFALEICADHGDRRAREEAGEYGVDVQILVSDGASVLASALAAHQGGIVITNDAKFIGETRGGRRDVSSPEQYLKRVAWGEEPNAGSVWTEGDAIDNEESGELLAGAPIEIER